MCMPMKPAAPVRRIFKLGDSDEPGTVRARATAELGPDSDLAYCWVRREEERGDQQREEEQPLSRFVNSTPRAIANVAESARQYR